MFIFVCVDVFPICVNKENLFYNSLSNIIFHHEVNESLE
jgi:hypothetical protein